MESVICDLCGDNHTKKLWTTSDRWTKTGQRFDIVRCLECGLVFVNPRPDKNEIERFYPEEYSPYHRSKKIRWFLKKNFQLAREVNILRKFLPEKAKILEIGAGGGEDLAFLRDRGKWLTEGTDLSPYAKETAQKEFRLNLTLGQLEEISFPNESFDLVRNKYVLEHVHSPKSMIGETYRILKPGGRLILWVPNFDSLSRMIFKSYWEGGEAPRHLYSFSKKTISEYLKYKNFSIEKIEQSVIPNTFIHSFRRILEDANMPDFILNFFRIENPLALILFFPLSILAALARKSDRLLVIARKPL
ncbi:hypothetical protein A2833_02600 [Candidatus Azambacteria bacterium RIFCSPHIGHO2_01_FULL_44_55]|uniref:Methyltransferase type 11 domain-containing protein n=1 Tax=Candidatus Azambacteria bacterium RIFCSPLOWO2_02_FULL_44_14 TaxID=1797306 RepID=A0A1F5CD33_9BACT|nr:MAG: hypothetical protein A3A18_01275 [Candidatus Azambacteria bacterium RIFCSPLOWO2_01_FULL_44_84]OGD33337.1 MAG: hypothetical protein A3C78_02170 [Candidatus Azambacteria bacterium RIFCSPHIGHO2_02_FULL_45_18]OGD40662.1 MAG: hypothetical protein A2833_02600 [Candidatus Azambacteria bacterium RIFCSPHIGHO2_01_FULL_44_55]OGD40764.1 MAG: hypothetical protein A3I30_01680 [Candidatus Azambacteria bacterium RIFCSPLOWO2_02_FULL_44_14]OGD52295.1 MAG: hypothetical protein A2608_01400 [Candidatus Azam